MNKRTSYLFKTLCFAIGLIIQIDIFRAVDSVPAQAGESIFITDGNGNTVYDGREGNSTGGTGNGNSGTASNETQNTGGTESIYDLAKAGGNEYGYNALNEVEKRIFNLLGKALEDFIGSEKYASDLDSTSAKIKIEYTANEGEELSLDLMSKVATHFLYSSPKYYFLDNGYSFDMTGNTYRLTLEVSSYYYSYNSRKEVDDAINSLLSEWVAKVSRDLNEKDAFYAALTAHDLIIENIDYAYDAEGKPQTGIWAHSIAGVFTGEGAVCEGYAKAFEFILDLAGIPNIYIVGLGEGQAHAWNAVQYNDKWYLCDVTWDDSNNEEAAGLRDADYTYFFVPDSLFSKKHSANGKVDEYGYELPKFAEDMENSFFGRFKCYSDITFTEETGAEFAEQVLNNRYSKSDYIFIAVTKEALNTAIKYVIPHLGITESSTGYSYINTHYGCLLKFKAPIIEHPSASIDISKEEAKIEIAESIEITATLDEGSDDRVIWSIANFDEKETMSPGRVAAFTARGTKATIVGKRNGKIILKALIYSTADSEEPISKTCVITVGTGESSADAVVWQNGGKDYKKAKLTTTLTATQWKDDKGKYKKGKLVWFASDSSLVPEFNSSKHTVSFRASKSQRASVNPKGEVTAKKAGTVYIYVCDTGSLKYDEFIVDVLAAPSKLYCTDGPNTTDKEDIIKKYYLEAGDSDRIYITPFLKDGEADAECSYTVKISKDVQKKNAAVSEVLFDDKGNPYFLIEALDFDRSKPKTVSVKIDVTCVESGKKASMNLVVGSSVLKAKLSNGAGSEDLSKKGNSITYSLDVETYLDDVTVTTDKIKVYVGKGSLYLDGDDKVVAEKGATVNVKYDQKTGKLTVTASKDAGAPAVVSAVFTNTITKEVSMIELLRVDESGAVKLN